MNNITYNILNTIHNSDNILHRRSYNNCDYIQKDKDMKKKRIFLYLKLKEVI